MKLILVFAEKRNEIIEALYDYIWQRQSKRWDFKNPSAIYRVSEDKRVVEEYVKSVYVENDDLFCDMETHEWYSDGWELNEPDSEHIDHYKENIQMMTLDEIYQILMDIDNGR